jgi:hypothetical protein
VQAVFHEEKRWVRDPASQIPETLSDDDRISWFVARVGDRAAGVIRLLYDCPIEIPAEFEVHVEREIDAEAARRCRWVEVGRFMIRPEYRSRSRVALELMRCAVAEVVTRGYTHFITDVYEGDRHSPLLFHTRVLGFERIGTHRFGELDCDCVRIVLILDLARAYRRAKERRNRIFRELTVGLREAFEALPVTSLF